MPAVAPPDSATMLAAAADWQRRPGRKATAARQPFIPLVEKLYDAGWKRTEVSRRCVDQGWVAEADFSGFYRWVCRQYDKLEAGQTLE